MEIQLEIGEGTTVSELKKTTTNSKRE